MAITATFQANFDQFVGAVKGAQASLDGIKTTATTVGTAVAASLAASEIRRFAGDVRIAADQFITAFAEEEAAVNKLAVALQAQGTGAAMEQYIALAAEFQRTTTFSDDLVLSMTALMVQVGGVMPDQMKAALTAAANLSAGLGISLEAATLLVAKAFGQGGEQLGKLKALLGDTVPKGANMAQVMEAINSKFGGQAAAQLETYTGRTAQLANQMSDFKEKVGELLIGALTPMMNAFASMPQGMQTAMIAVVAIGTALAPLALSVAALIPVMTALAAAIGGAAGLSAALGGLAAFLGPAGIIAAGIIAWFQVFKNLDVFIWAAKASWDALTGTFKSSVAAIVDTSKAIYEGLKGWLVDRFTSIVASIKAQVEAVIGVFTWMYEAVVGHSIIPDMVDGIAEQMARLQSVMVEPAEAAASKTMAALSQVAQAVKAAGAQAATNRQGGSFTVPTITVTEATRASLQNRLAAIESGYQRYAGRQAGVNGATGNLTSKDWAAMLREQVEYAALKAALGRAGGGPVSAGSPYIVGERGPELFVPRGAGTIVPNGGGGVTIMPGAIVIQGSVLSERDLLEKLKAALTRAILQGQKVAA